jgi:L-lactate utilization protein LutB
MESPIERYWEKRLESVKGVLESNHFQVFVARDASQAKEVLIREILPGTGAKSVSLGGSKTFMDMGLSQTLRDNPGLDFINPFAAGLSPEESMELRGKALLAEAFITGTNAITEAGQLVNLDRTGNRVAAIAFGPKHVIILAGRNKIVPDLEEAVGRIKNFAAPLVAARVGAKTPCVQTSYCEDCKSPDRVCNTWSIVEKSYPKGRVKIVLINEDLGF